MAECPFCGYEGNSAGSIIMHIRSSSDKEHGTKGNMPSGCTKDQIIKMVENGEKVYIENHDKGIEEEVETSNINNQIHNQEVSQVNSEATQGSESSDSESDDEQQQVSEIENNKDEESKDLMGNLDKLKEIPNIEERINGIATEVNDIRDTNKYYTEKINKIQEQIEELSGQVEKILTVEETIEDIKKRVDIHKQILEELLRKLGAKDKDKSIPTTTESGKEVQKEEEETEGGSTQNGKQE